MFRKTKFIKNKTFSLPYEICNNEIECISDEVRKISCESLSKTNVCNYMFEHLDNIDKQESLDECIDSKLYSKRQVYIGDEIDDDNDEEEEENDYNNVKNKNYSNIDPRNIKSIDVVEYNVAFKNQKDGFDQSSNVVANRIVVPQMANDGSIVFTLNNTRHNYLRPNSIGILNFDKETQKLSTSFENITIDDEQFVFNPEKELPKQKPHNAYSQKERLHPHYLNFMLQLKKSQDMV